MNDVLSDLQQRVSQLVRRGVVADIRHGSPIAVKVRMGKIVSPWLPWCPAQASSRVQMRIPPAVGDAVTVLCESGDPGNGRVYPGANIDAVPVPEGNDDDHVIRFSDGTTIIYDPVAHAYTFTLAADGQYTINGNITLNGNVEITKTLTVRQDIKGDGDITDRAGSMTGIRTVYNGHTHPGDSGATTQGPNQTMPE